MDFASAIELERQEPVWSPKTLARNSHNRRSTQRFGSHLPVYNMQGQAWPLIQARPAPKSAPRSIEWQRIVSSRS